MRKWLAGLAFFLMFCGLAPAQSQDDLLPVEQAFKVKASLAEPGRIALNRLIRTGPKQGVCDFVIDVARDSRIGWRGCDQNTTYYYTDRVHMIDAGYYVAAELAFGPIMQVVSNHLTPQLARGRVRGAL